MKARLLILTVLCMATNAMIAQRAELHVQNNSSRQLTVKIMKYDINGNEEKFALLSIAPRSEVVQYFSKTGNFFLKTKAQKQNSRTIYKKGDPFEVYVGRDGYSVLTITYSITETNVKNPMEGEEISRDEFEKD